VGEMFIASYLILDPQVAGVTSDSMKENKNKAKLRESKEVSFLNKYKNNQLIVSTNIRLLHVTTTMKRKYKKNKCLNFKISDH
jgi:hypothetical protein